MKLYIIFSIMVLLLNTSILTAQDPDDRAVAKTVATNPSDLCPKSDLCETWVESRINRCYEFYESYARAYDTNSIGNQIFITQNLFAMNGHNANIVIKGATLSKPLWFTATNWNNTSLQYSDTRRYIDAGDESGEHEEGNKCRIKGVADNTDIGTEVGDVDFRVNANSAGDGEIRLHPGFTVESGAEFHAYIKPRLYNLARYEYNFAQELSGAANGDAVVSILRQRWNVSDDAVADLHINNTNVVVNPITSPDAGMQFTPQYITSQDRVSEYALTDKIRMHTSNEPFGRYECLMKMCTRAGIRVCPWYFEDAGDAYIMECDVPETNTGVPTSTSCRTCKNSTGFVLIFIILLLKYGL
ncbi:MAG: hypothetical protein HYZ54_13595 [Ignavibacteriae bacterium]|nr:hypothetical protein [Ignavibacteriota bacterium]